MTLAKIEKAIGKKEFNRLVGDQVIENPGKPALAPEGDKRPKITNQPTADQVFNIQGGN